MKGWREREKLKVKLEKLDLSSLNWVAKSEGLSEGEIAKTLDSRMGTKKGIMIDKILDRMEEPAAVVATWSPSDKKVQDRCCYQLEQSVRYKISDFLRRNDVRSVEQSIAYLLTIAGGVGIWGGIAYSITSGEVVSAVVGSILGGFCGAASGCGAFCGRDGGGNCCSTQCDKLCGQGPSTMRKDIETGEFLGASMDPFTIKKLVGKPGQRRVEISQTDNFDFNPDMDRETGGLKNSKKHKSKKHKSKKRKSKRKSKKRKTKKRKRSSRKRKTKKKV